MSGPFRENWKRLSNRYPPNDAASAMEAKDILRVEDLAASGAVVTSGNVTEGALLVGTALGTWDTLPSGQEGEALRVLEGQVQWGPSGSGTGGGGTTLTGSPGDLIYATGVDAFGNLPIGSNGQVLTVVAGAPAWAAPSGGAGGSAGGPINVTVETSATTTITNSDYLVAASGSTTVNLPPTPDDGQRHIIKDSTGTAGSSNITVSGNGFLIDDSATASLVNNYEAMTIIFSSVLGRWQLV